MWEEGLYSISQRLVAGRFSAESIPAPQFEFGASVGASLALIMAKLGAHSSVQPGRPENVPGSIQEANVFVLSKAVETSPLSIHAMNFFSHFLKKEKYKF